MFTSFYSSKQKEISFKSAAILRASEQFAKGLFQQPVKYGCDFSYLFKTLETVVVSGEKSPSSMFFTQVVEDRAIRIHGWNSKKLFDQVFFVGDLVSYQRNHRIYFGEILSISLSGVLISDSEDPRPRQLDLIHFSELNYKFSLADAFYHNSMVDDE